MAQHQSERRARPSTEVSLLYGNLGPTVNPLTIALTSAGIALVSGGMSAVTLWRTHLAPFKPMFAVGDLSFRVFPIRSGDERWFIASYHAAITVTNVGARAGHLKGLRLAITYPTLTFEHKELMPARFVVDGEKYESAIARDLFSWGEQGIFKGHWMPAILLPKESVTQHLLFEARWEQPVIQPAINIRLEVLVENNASWVPAATWTTSLSEWMWSELTRAGTSFTVSPDGSELSAWGYTEPRSLHRYTRPRGELGDHEPVDSSFLDYPDDEKSPTKLPPSKGAL